MAETNPWMDIGSSVLYDMILASKANGGHIETNVNKYINHSSRNIFILNLHDIQKDGGGFYFHFQIYNTADRKIENIDIHVTIHNKPLPGQENNQYHISITNWDMKPPIERKNIHLIIQKVNNEVITSIPNVAYVKSVVQNLFREKPQYFQDNIQDIIAQIVPSFMTQLITEYHKLALHKLFKFGIYTHAHQKGIDRQQSISDEKETLMHDRDFRKYYNKYLKYKQKYLELKKQLNL